MRYVVAVAIVTSLLVGLRDSHAQPSSGTWRVGYLGYRYPTEARDIEAFRQRLADLGHVGGNVVIESRLLEPGSLSLASAAGELVRLKPDVMLAYGNATIAALKRATSTIPIVMISAGDPVGTGLVSSLAHPGGNVTGLSNLSEGLSVKWFELLMQMVPSATRLGVLMGRHTHTNDYYFQQIKTAGERMGVGVVSLQVGGRDDIERAFGTLAKPRAHGLVVLPNPVPLTHEAQIVNLAARHRLPAIYPYRHFAERGGLMAYSADRTEMYRQAAVFVDKILKGARPADLPVEQPTRFELAINLATAKALGLTIPPAVLGRADRVIE